MNIEEIKDQVYLEIENYLRSEFVGSAATPELLTKFEIFACGVIAQHENVDPARIKIFGLRYANGDTAIVFNGYQILPA